MSTAIQRSFSAGEVAPELYARADQVRYATGLRQCLNQFIRRSGGASNRAGTEFVAEVADSSKRIREIEFRFNNEQTYMLEFGDGYMRVHRLAAQVVNATKAITGATAANPCELTVVAHGYASGSEVAVSGIVGAIGLFLNNRNFKVVSTGADTFTLQYMDGSVVNSATFGAYTSGGTVAEVYEIVTPYAEADLPDIRFVQSGDVITLTHPSHPSMELSRTGHTSWTLGVADDNPSIAQPDGGTASGSGGATSQYYRITAVAQGTDEESLPGFGASTVISGATAANPVVVTDVAHGFSNGDEIYIAGVVGMTELNGRRFKIKNKAADTYELIDNETGANINGSGYTAYSSGGTARRTYVRVDSVAVPSTSAPITVTIPQLADVSQYNIYRGTSGVYGFIGVAVGATFLDVGAAADTSDTPPQDQELFQATGDYPTCVGYSQQRKFYAGTNNDPERVTGSRTGKFNNFTKSQPIQDDDAVSFIVAGNQVNAVQHLLELGKLLVFTSGGEISIEGDSNGVIRPNAVNPKQNTYNGSGFLRPLVANGNALYVQARGSVVRDLRFRLDEDGYKGDDLSTWSAHLFDGHSIVDWAYQQIPHSIVWAVREDGLLLGMTYVPSQQIVAWHRHDLGGIVENVCVIPEEGEDYLYLCIKRTVDGQTRRYIERMASRQIVDIKDAIFVDSCLSYDGRNTNAMHTMTLTGSGWTHGDTLTLTSSASYFTADDEGNNIHLRAADGTLIRCEIRIYSSATVVFVRPLDMDVPAAMRTVAITDWGKAVDQLNGLWHLEGEDLGILADAKVAASPNNEEYTVKTVVDGQVEIATPAEVIHVGRPITADLELLDLDTVQTETLIDKNKAIGKVTLYVAESRGIFVGPRPPEESEKYDAADPDPLLGLDELKIRGAAGEGYYDAVSLLTGKADVNIGAQWNDNGRIFIRQVDPLPLTVLAAAPAGYVPLRG